MTEEEKGKRVGGRDKDGFGFGFDLGRDVVGA
jgi:hypothetical protein